MKRALCYLLLSSLLSAAVACNRTGQGSAGARVRPFASNLSPTIRRVVEDAIDQTRYTVSYDPSYVKLNYPGGDVPLDRGVCSDVIVRSFRKVGVDLQKEVHEDMASSFNAYPKKWGLAKPDANIDHRRVPNLMTFFERKGKALAVTNSGADYQPGDVVTWDLGGGITHIGLVTNLWSDDTGNYLIAHNIGGGVRLENVLFSWRITGHYRYF
ncbi:MAG: DUF1287 domain-containing protein [Pyrinomonadaceae bacterium]|nr:DUF1287 domain-containing protein [Pyrinomonadaceae bacterium]